MSDKQLTYLRTSATAIITALSVAYTYYPNQIWITTVIAAAGAIGIHSIPAIKQENKQVFTVSRSIPVSETPEVAPEAVPAGNLAGEIDGLALMGLRAPVTDYAQPEQPPAEQGGPVSSGKPPAPEQQKLNAPKYPPVSPEGLRALAVFLESL